MSDGVVIDANVISEFYQEYKKESGLVYETVTWMLTHTGVAINDHISTEWENTCGASLFMTWYTDQLKLGNIRGVESARIPRELIKRMGIDFGFPIRSMDIHYVRCAYSTSSTKYIVTYNYHFYEPKCSQQSASAKSRAREQRLGKFCCFLFDKLGITVGMPSHCKSDFCIP